MIDDDYEADDFKDIAIAQHLSGPRPNFNACGCVGCQPMSDKPYEAFLLVQKDTSNIPQFVAIRSILDISISALYEQIKNGKIFIPTENCDQIYQQFKDAKIPCTLAKNFPMFPKCPCMMQMVEKVETNIGERFFQINEIRNPSGISFSVTDLGPVGGPYLKG